MDKEPTITLEIEDAKTWLKAVDETKWITMSGDYWREFFPVIKRLRSQVDEWDKYMDELHDRG